MTFTKFLVPLMLTVHQMPLKNHFLSGIGAWYDKTPNQNEPMSNTILGFTDDCLGVDYSEEGFHRKTTTSHGTEIHYNKSKKSDVELMLCAWGFESVIIQNSKIKSKKIESDSFMMILTFDSHCKETRQ